MSNSGNDVSVVDMGNIVGETAQGELLSLVNGAGVVLDGIVFSPADPARLSIVHVHGSPWKLLSSAVHTSDRESSNNAWNLPDFL